MDDRFDDFPSFEKETEKETDYKPSPNFQQSMPEFPVKATTRKGNMPAAALCFALIGGILGAVITGLFYPRISRTSSETQNAPEVSYILESRRQAALEILPADDARLQTPAQVYAENVNSTVGITTSITTNFWGYQTTSAASGSGFIISGDGYILTNYHVIEESDSISVSLYDGTAYDAQLIGYDESNDIAVLKVEAADLMPVILGNSDILNVGDSVLAIGNPLGELTFSLTAGTVSAKDRKVTLSSTVTMDLIQTDCAINSGNSGGALFNLYGEVIGITNAKYSGSSPSQASIDNIGFAIPINNVMPIVESIIEKGYVSKPYMGIMVSDVSPEIQLYGIPKGAAVQSVAQDGPAARAGLQPGDIITKVNGTDISGSTTLVDMVGRSRPNDTLVLTVYRQGQTLEVTVTIEEKIQTALQKEESQITRQRHSKNLYPYGG